MCIRDSNYGRDEEALEAAYRLFDNAKGLLGNEPINENYNPETGDRLNASNFGWSSAAFYNLFVNTLSGAAETTSQKVLDIPEDVYKRQLHIRCTVSRKIPL